MYGPAASQEKLHTCDKLKLQEQQSFMLNIDKLCEEKNTIFVACIHTLLDSCLYFKYH